MNDASPYLSFDRARLSARSIWHEPSVHAKRVKKAELRLRDSIGRLGYAEALWVGEQLGFDGWGIWFERAKDDFGVGQLKINLSDLQLIAFAAALRAHHEVIKMQISGSSKREEASEEAPKQARKKRKKKRFADT